MKAYDFSYDNKKLSDFGLVICHFGDEGLTTISNGSVITFNTISTLGGEKHYLASTQYEENLASTIQVCKSSCISDIEEITSTELRELMRWLNRKDFKKFKILDEGHIDIYYEAAINISRIELNGKIYGLELNIITNSPFPRKEPKTIIIRNTKSNGTYSINDGSYEEGYAYYPTEITINQSGDLKIHNAIEDRTTFIANCKKDEVIIMNYPLIQSSDSSHAIQNDFNWNFFRIANTYENSRNDLTISLPCTIKIEYSPIVKIGL